MADLIRSVALAICKSRTCEGVSCCQWPANMGRHNCNAKQGAYDDAARDAMVAVCAYLVETGRDTGSTIHTIKAALAPADASRQGERS